MKLKQLNVKATYENHHNGNLEHDNCSYILKEQKSPDIFLVLQPNGRWGYISLSDFVGCETEVEIKNDIDEKLMKQMKKCLKNEIIFHEKEIEELEKTMRKVFSRKK